MTFLLGDSSTFFFTLPGFLYPHVRTYVWLSFHDFLRSRETYNFTVNKNRSIFADTQLKIETFLFWISNLWNDSTTKLIRDCSNSIFMAIFSSLEDVAFESIAHTPISAWSVSFGSRLCFIAKQCCWHTDKLIRDRNKKKRLVLHRKANKK